MYDSLIRCYDKFWYERSRFLLVLLSYIHKLALAKLGPAWFLSSWHILPNSIGIWYYLVF